MFLLNYCNKLSYMTYCSPQFDAVGQWLAQQWLLLLHMEQNTWGIDLHCLQGNHSFCFPCSNLTVEEWPWIWVTKLVLAFEAFQEIQMISRVIIPWLQMKRKKVNQGLFKVISEMPLWYRWAVVSNSCDWQCCEFGEISACEAVENGNGSAD